MLKKNFHVWNDVWMVRPDLPPGYDGWQAIDATPQETSDGVFCMGPMPLNAIKDGSVYLPYDGPFVYAEVNGDKVIWEKSYSEGTCTIKDIKKNYVGSGILTRKITEDETKNLEENITDQYKYPEGGEENQKVAKRIRRHGRKLHDTDFEEKKDLKCGLLVPQMEVLVGKPFDISVTIRNLCDEVRKVKGNIYVYSKFYTGILYRSICVINDEVELQPNQETVLTHTITGADYFDKLTDYCIMTVNAHLTVNEPKQTYVLSDDMELFKPEVNIQVEGKMEIENTIKVKASFDNPLDLPLTHCELRAEGPGLRGPHLMKIPKGVAANGKFEKSFEITPAKPGDRELVLVFNCDQMISICGTKKMKIGGQLEEEEDD